MATNEQLRAVCDRLAVNGYLDHAGVDRVAALREAMEHAGVLPSEDAAERAQGEYWEEVQKLVDGVIEDVKARRAATRLSVRVATREAATVLAKGFSADEALAALRYARDHDQDALRAMAVEAFAASCRAELKTRPEYVSIPEAAKPSTEVADGDLTGPARV